MREMQGPKYLTLWKDGRWVFLKRGDFELRQGIVKKISKRLKKLFRKQ